MGWKRDCYGKLDYRCIIKYSGKDSKIVEEDILCHVKKWTYYKVRENSYFVEVQMLSWRCLYWDKIIRRGGIGGKC